MRSLARAESANTLFHIIRLLINESQYNFDLAVVQEAGAADISTILIRDARDVGFSSQTVFSEGDRSYTGKISLTVVEKI